MADTYSNDERPQICSEGGLACEDCTSTTAQQVAKVCKGLRGKMIGQLFVQIYTDSACARMHSHFAEAYRIADAEFAEARQVVDAAPARKAPAYAAHAQGENGYVRREVTFARPRTMAAIA